MICLLLIPNIYTQATSTESQSFAKLGLSISTSKTTFVPLEPIPIKFSLRNETDKSISGHASLRFVSNFVEIFLRSAGEPNVRKIDPLSRDRVRSIGRNTLIPPGAVIEHTELMSIDLDKYFLNPGVYEMRASFKNRGSSEKIQSDWVTITITEPQGIDRAALEFLKTGPDLSNLYSGNNTEEQKDYLESFLANYAESSYSPYISLRLAGFYVWCGELDKAKPKLNKLKELKNFARANEVDEYLKELERKSKLAQY